MQDFHDDLHDPVRRETFHGVWRRWASFNTRIFERVFPGIPSNGIRTFADLPQPWKGTMATAQPLDEHRRQLAKVQGLLCVYPDGLFADQDIRPSLLYGDTAALVSNAVFV